MLKTKTVLIWDSSEPYPDNDEFKVLWRSYATKDLKTEISLPKFVEDKADKLRLKYLSFIYDLGELEISGKRVIKHLEISPGFSFWWMTQVGKNHYLKTAQIHNIVKLIAIEEWLDNKNYATIKIATENSKLAESVKMFAIQKGVLFKRTKLPSKKKSESFIRSAYNLLPDFLKAIVSLSRYLLNRWKLKGVGVSRWKNSSAKITFFSYFNNFDIDASDQGIFKDKYWTKLPYFLEQNEIKSNWLHIYVKSELLPTVDSAKKLIQNFNKSNIGMQNHLFLDSFLSLHVVMRTIIDWIKVIYKYMKIKSKIKQKAVYFWPLVESDLKISLIGSNSTQNLLYYHLFRRAMQMLPTQKKGFYLQENQGWEFGLISAWREFMHEKLIGVPHTTVRFWDLRYFFDSRTFNRTDIFDIPQPDKITVNGEETKIKFINGGYPIDKLVDVEALRFLFLGTLSKKIDSFRQEDKINTLLVFTDYLQKNVTLQMSLLKQAVKMTDKKNKYIIKPHPGNPILAEDFPEMDIKVSNSPSDELLDCCNVVYTSSLTSAAVDAYCAGKKVVTFLDPGSLNLSPLKGCDDVDFVQSANELFEILDNIENFNINIKQGKDFFYIDQELPRWRKLLEGDGN